MTLLLRLCDFSLTCTKYPCLGISKMWYALFCALNISGDMFIFFRFRQFCFFNEIKICTKFSIFLVILSAQKRQTTFWKSIYLSIFHFLIYICVYKYDFILSFCERPKLLPFLLLYFLSLNLFLVCSFDS